MVSFNIHHNTVLKGTQKGTMILTTPDIGINAVIGLGVCINNSLAKTTEMLEAFEFDFCLREYVGNASNFIGVSIWRCVLA